ncbi:hypothetical protein LCGC14_2790850, partial [marine sediment metagenome]
MSAEQEMSRLMTEAARPEPGTPLPWHWDVESRHIRASDGDWVLMDDGPVHWQAMASDLAYIVYAVNSVPGLEAALLAYRDCLRGLHTVTVGADSCACELLNDVTATPEPGVGREAIAEEVLAQIEVERMEGDFLRLQREHERAEPPAPAPRFVCEHGDTVGFEECDLPVPKANADLSFMYCAHHGPLHTDELAEPGVERDRAAEFTTAGEQVQRLATQAFPAEPPAPESLAEQVREMRGGLAMAGERDV